MLPIFEGKIVLVSSRRHADRWVLVSITRYLYICANHLAQGWLGSPRERGRSGAEGGLGRSRLERKSCWIDWRIFWNKERRNDRFQILRHGCGWNGRWMGWDGREKEDSGELNLAKKYLISMTNYWVVWYSPSPGIGKVEPPPCPSSDCRLSSQIRFIQLNVL